MAWSANEMRERGESTIESVNRLKLLLGYKQDNFDEKKKLEVQLGKYGLGDRRTLQQAIQFSGVDTTNLVSLGNYCGNIAYVPFIEHPFGPDYIPKYDPVTLKYDDVRDPASVFYNVSNPDNVLKWITAKTEYEQLHHANTDNNNNIEPPTYSNNNINVHRNYPNPNLDHTANYILIIFSIGMFLIAIAMNGKLFRKLNKNSTQKFV